MKEREILYYVYEPIHTYPPCFAQVCQLSDLGFHVTVLTKSCDPVMAQILQEKQVKIVTIDPGIRNRFLFRVVRFFRMRRLIRKFSRENREKKGVLWIGSERNFLVRGQMHLLLRQKPEVVNFLEFFEWEPYQGVMKKVAPQISVLTACETHRADYMVKWWGLSRRPYLLANKPYHSPRTREISPSCPASAEAVEKMKGHKVILYQGKIDRDRDLRPFAKGLSLYAGISGQSGLFVLTGNVKDESMIQELQTIYPKTVYLGNFPAPLHLEITSYARIGVACYNDDSINNRYCAPNKIYEYAAFGIPMLCSDVPGLSETIGKNRAGICVDFRNPSAVCEGLRKIEGEYELFSRNAVSFYDRTDNLPTMREITEKAFRRCLPQSGLKGENQKDGC